MVHWRVQLVGALLVHDAQLGVHGAVDVAGQLRGGRGAVVPQLGDHPLQQRTPAAGSAPDRRIPGQQM